MKTKIGSVCRAKGKLLPALEDRDSVIFPQNQEQGTLIVHFKRFSFPELKCSSLVTQPSPSADATFASLCHPVGIGLQELARESTDPLGTAVAVNYTALSL